MLVYKPKTNVPMFRPMAWKGSRRVIGGILGRFREGARQKSAPLKRAVPDGPMKMVVQAASSSVERVVKSGDRFHHFRVVARARRIKGLKRGVDYRRFWLTLLRRNPKAAERMVYDLLRCYRPQQLYLRLLVPALTLSGTMFALGRITYHDEHYITWQCLRLMRVVRREMIPLSANGLCALATGVGQDSHRIGLRMVCDLMDAAGWRTRFLSTNERGTLRAALKECRTDAILLSIGRASEFEQARRMIAEARRAGFKGVVAIGGRAVAEDVHAVEKTGADLTAANGLDLSRKLTIWCRNRTLGRVLERRENLERGDDPHNERAVG